MPRLIGLRLGKKSGARAVGVAALALWGEAAGQHRAVARLDKRPAFFMLALGFAILMLLYLSR
ncbi:MAG: hypothetical protein ACREFQ_21805 [Stellaceae bacterium]